MVIRRLRASMTHIYILDDSDFVIDWKALPQTKYSRVWTIRPRLWGQTCGFVAILWLYRVLAKRERLCCCGRLFAVVEKKMGKERRRDICRLRGWRGA